MFNVVFTLRSAPRNFFNDQKLEKFVNPWSKACTPVSFPGQVDWLSCVLVYFLFYVEEFILRCFVLPYCLHFPPFLMFNLLICSLVFSNLVFQLWGYLCLFPNLVLFCLSVSSQCSCSEYISVPFLIFKFQVFNWTYMSVVILCWSVCIQ